MAQRSIRKVIQALRIYCERKAIWDMVLPEIVAMINATFNSTVGDSPHYAVFGFDRRNALSSNTRVTMNEMPNQASELVIDCKQVIHEAVKHTTAARILDYNKKKVLDELKKGQRVFVHKSVLPDSYDKIVTPFQGPFIVEKKVFVNSYQVKHLFDNRVRTLHRHKKNLDAMSQMAKHYGIQLKTSTPYHPQGNGMAERSVRKVIQALRIYCERKAIWDTVLPEIVAMINATFKAALH